MWIDAHCHPSSAGCRDDAARWLQRAGENAVGRLICCGTHPGDWPVVADWAQRFPDRITPAFGLHPWFVASAPRSWPDQLLEYLAIPGSLVGEIGLDGCAGHPSLEVQLVVLRRQLDIAIARDRPVVIHLVRAWSWIERLLSHAPHGLPHGILFHGFAGTPAMVSKIMAWGGYVSVSGAILDSRRRRLRETVRAICKDRLLIETDAPDGRAPGRERSVEPADLPVIAAALAECRGTRVAALREQTHRNTLRWLAKY